jgi:hypothetical protein
MAKIKPTRGNAKQNPRKEVDLLRIQDDFEELGRKSPSLGWKNALGRIGHARELVDARGKPISLTAKNFLRLCLKAFRRGQREGKKSGSRTGKTAGKVMKKTA